MESGSIQRRAVHISGVVQGVGFRPFVYRIARELGLAGWVRNEADGIRLEIAGAPQSLGEFLTRVRTQHPRAAIVETIDVRELDAGRPLTNPFEIHESAAIDRTGPVIPSDLAVCADCLAEIRTPGSRRYRYPFTSCSYCGPRYSIVESIPYDRARTSMRRFEMCPECDAEYRDPSDRRFHAQPIACPRCGPQLGLLHPDGTRLAAGDDALDLTVQALARGEVIALKGLGGFQLIADATNRAAVAELRDRKRRPDKPFAVMFSTIEMARACCEISTEEEQILSSPQSPIVLIRRIAPCPIAIADNVAPRNPCLGVMLPYTPLHDLILAGFRKPVVCTSGNLSEEPICNRTDEAVARLGRVADLFLTHDRRISRPLDDSVIRITGSGPIILRRARGYAPIAVGIGIDGRPILALGGHLKNTVALAIGKHVVMSQHIGELGTSSGRDAFRNMRHDLIRFFDVQPEAVACDLHPDYASTREAEELSERWRVPLFRVQHHHAHIAACMAEHSLKGPVLGFAWDGSGYGDDRTVWGGEALVCDRGRFTRVAHMRPFPLIGGARAIRDPRRAALGVLYSIFGGDAAKYAAPLFDESEIAMLLTMAEQRINAPLTTSVGRLFDAVAALSGVCRRASFEGQAAMQLEYALSAGAASDGAYPIALNEGTPIAGDWEVLIKALLEDVKSGVDPALISARFHNALVRFAVEVAARVGVENVALSGGCLQNAYLASRMRAAMRDGGFKAYIPQRFPPNDGGISLGQIFVTRHLMKEATNVPGRAR